MENLEEDTQESNVTTIAASNTALDLTTSSRVTLPVMEDFGSLVEENLDDSVILIHQRMDMVDLTSPTQPQQSSASTSAGAGSSISSSTLLGPLTFEEPSCSKDTLKDSTCLTASSTTENPSSSTSGSAVASSIDAGAAASVATTTTATTTNVLECPICLQTCIHPARLPCGHIFCFLCVKGVAYKNRRCAMCRREIPPEFLDHPQLVNGIEDICTTKATDDGYQWFYEGRNGGWWAYDKRTAIEIEEVFQYLHNNTQTQTQEEVVKKEEVTQIKRQDANPIRDLQNNDNSDSYDDEDEENYYDDEEDDFEYMKLPTIDNSNHTYRIQICGSMYILDFKSMVQYPENMPQRRRKICRAKGLPSKGVAGILGSSSHHRRGWRNHRYMPYHHMNGYY